MELVEFHCTECGGRLKFENGGYQCQNHPDHFFAERDILGQREKLRLILGEVFSEELLKAEEKNIAQLRSNLWKAVHAEFISYKDIKDCCNKLKDKDSNDYQANFYADIISGIPVKMNTRLNKTDVSERGIVTFIEFAIRLFDSKSNDALSDIIERYGKEGGAKYKELKNGYLKKAKEIREKIRNVDIAYDCFVSYDNREKTEVDKLVGELETGKNKLKCFVAYRNLPDDHDNFWTNIHKAMKNCKMFLLVSSDKSRNNDNVLNELGYWMNDVREDFRIFRAEYLLEEYSKDDSEGDRTVKEDFTDYGLTWFEQGEEKELIHKLCTFKRDAKYIKSTESGVSENQNTVGFSQPNQNMKYCLNCGTANVLWAEVCSKKGCGGEQFADSYEKYIDYKKEKEYNEKYQKEIQAEQEKLRKAHEEELARSRRELEKLRKELEEEYNKKFTAINAVKSENPTLENYNKNEFEIEGTVLKEYKLKDKSGEVKIPYGVTAIGENAFAKCEKLTYIEIPDSVTSIGCDAFRCCSGLTSITIPDSVNEIGIGAFSGCSGLTSITIPNSVIGIGPYAFGGCSGLTSITIPDGVTSIGDYAFGDCRSLTSITIPDSVNEIGPKAFSGCSGFEKITVAKGNSVYYDKDNCLIEKGTNKLILGCKNSIVPDSVTSIGCDAFSGCSSLTSITIPDSVNEIGIGAFFGCSGLTSIIIPDSVTYIGWWAFSGCSGLQSITMPKKLKQCIKSAFREEKKHIKFNLTK